MPLPGYRFDIAENYSGLVCVLGKTHHGQCLTNRDERAEVDEASNETGDQGEMKNFPPCPPDDEIRFLGTATAWRDAPVWRRSGCVKEITHSSNRLYTCDLITLNRGLPERLFPDDLGSVNFVHTFCGRGNKFFSQGTTGTVQNQRLVSTNSQLSCPIQLARGRWT
jgi:hypothetical protein